MFSNDGNLCSVMEDCDIVIKVEFPVITRTTCTSEVIKMFSIYFIVVLSVNV